MIKLSPYAVLCVLAGCASPALPPWDSKTVAPAPEPLVMPSQANVFEPIIPRLSIRNATDKGGELSYQVEKMARQDACRAAEPSTLMNSRPGVQFYRVRCEDGRQILFKCEMRQCFIEN